MEEEEMSFRMVETTEGQRRADLDGGWKRAKARLR